MEITWERMRLNDGWKTEKAKVRTSFSVRITVKHSTKLVFVDSPRACFVFPYFFLFSLFFFFLFVQDGVVVESRVISLPAGGKKIYRLTVMKVLQGISSVDAINLSKRGTIGFEVYLQLFFPSFVTDKKECFVKYFRTVVRLDGSKA